MKLVFSIIASLVVGLILGVGSAAIQVGSYELPVADVGTSRTGISRTGISRTATSRPGASGTAIALPRVQIDRQEYDFGVMQLGAQRDHTFVFENRGDAALVLTRGSSSCQCTHVELTQQEVPPGGSHSVKIEWTARKKAPLFREHATVTTNDPSRPEIELTIHGQVRQMLEMRPSELVFSRVVDGEEKSAEIELLAFEEPPLELSRYSFRDEKTAGNFLVDVQDIEPTELPDPNAKSGKRVRVTIKPGLPVGLIRQGLILRTNVATESRLEIPIRGHVVSEISVLGSGWSPKKGFLWLGHVRSEEGIRRELNVFIRGEDADKVELSVTKVVPDWIQVKFGQQVSVKKDGTVVRMPLVVEIPKGSRAVNHLGANPNDWGEISIKTTHPRVDMLRLYLRFAVGT